MPPLRYSIEFMATLMNNPVLLRNIAIIGHLQHGKTVFVDTLVQASQEIEWDPVNEIRYTDTRKDEQERCISIKSTPISLVLENLKAKSYLLNMIDCPGHVNFSDESTAALRAVDGAVVVVDAIEGVMLNTERLIKHTVEANVKLCLIITKVDRLILELKLPPQDAYYKLMHTLEEINTLIKSSSGPNSKPQRLSPDLGNVCFASGQHGWSFTCLSFAEKYCSMNPKAGMDPKEFAKRLWGDWYHDDSNNTFTKKKPSSSAARTFVQYILEPIYKLYSHVVGETPEDLAIILKSLGIAISSKEIHMDCKPLLKVVMSRFFGYPRGFVEMIVEHVPSPFDGNKTKVAQHYTGYQTSSISQSMRECNPNGPLMINVVKLYSSPDGSKFHALGRIYSGTVQNGQRVRVLGEGFSVDDDEDLAVLEVSGLHVSKGRFSFQVDSAIAGNWILLDGVDGPIKKTATITDMNVEDVAIFRPLRFNTLSTMKLAVEPLNPTELPKMVDALRRISKSYPLITTKVEESGEHVIMGTGELYMDCVMHDLRYLYSDNMEVKVADPVVNFCETVGETSSLKCFAETPNKRNKLTMIAEPLEQGLAEDIENNVVNLGMDKKAVGDFFRSKYDWDLLAARSIWAFGPTDSGANILLDDTLPSEVDKGMLNTVRESIIQGFRWGCREGPLCDEPVRNVKFKIIDASIASEAIYRGGGQIIPTARRNIYSSFLMASPRIMEPVYFVEIQAPADCVQAIYPVLARRRGHVAQDAPKPGAPFYKVSAYIPVMDSFGFETDLRSYTQGQVFCQQVFDHWSIVAGDPLDEDIVLHPLEPSPSIALAKDFMVKTRRRKGLNENVSIGKFFDDAMLVEMAAKRETR